jgi:hypothetical protein
MNVVSTVTASASAARAAAVAPQTMSKDILKMKAHRVNRVADCQDIALLPLLFETCL